MKKTLILLRHGHRDNSVRALDNGLSEKGQRQSKWIRKFADKRFSRREITDLKAVFLSSPKKRCMETLQPLSDLWEIAMEVRKDLDEMRENESMQDFKERISKFKEWWIKQAPPMVFLSTHGDWLPVATDILLGFPVPMKKGAWLEVEWDLTHCELRSYIPTFKIFYGD